MHFRFVPKFVQVLGLKKDLEDWICIEEETYSEDDEDLINFVSSGVILALCYNVLASVLMFWISDQHSCSWLLLMVSFWVCVFLTGKFTDCSYGKY